MSPEEQEKSGVYVEMPRGFSQPNKVCKLKKSLWGLKNSPRNWFKMLSTSLQELGFESAEDVDPCLFISEKVICLTYVDDCIFFAPNPKDIDKIVKLLRERKFELTEEDDVAGFLGIDITKTPTHIKLTQKGLIQRIIDALQISDLHPVKTPATEVIGKDLDGDPPDCAFNYASVVGMLWYLTNNSRPELTFAVSQAARFSFCPMRSHELALIRIGQYLKGTSDKGLMLIPIKTDTFVMDAYVDSDFLGIYGKEERADPDNVRSRTGYVIELNGCPICWNSHLQNSICVSTMMAEYYALSTCMREVLPLRDLVRRVAIGCGLNEACETTFKVTVGR